MVERARLESVCTATYRGFKSLPHRQLKQQNRKKPAPHPQLHTLDLNPKEGSINSRSELRQGA